MSESKQSPEDHLKASNSNSRLAVILKNVAKRYCNAEPDFTIVCNQNRRQVHKSILELNSDVLAKVTHGAFQESQKAELILDAEMPAAVDAMIDYMYNFSYTIPQSHQENALKILAHLVVLADQWNIAGLKHLASHHLTRLLKDDENVHLADLTEALEVAYAAEMATKEIRESLTTWVHTSGVLAGDPPGWVIDAFKGAMGSMAVDIIKGYADTKASWSSFVPTYDDKKYYKHAR